MHTPSNKVIPYIFLLYIAFSHFSNCSSSSSTKAEYLCYWWLYWVDWLFVFIRYDFSHTHFFMVCQWYRQNFFYHGYEPRMIKWLMHSEKTQYPYLILIRWVNHQPVSTQCDIWIRVWPLYLGQYWYWYLGVTAFTLLVLSDQLAKKQRYSD